MKSDPEDPESITVHRLQGTCTEEERRLLATKFRAGDADEAEFFEMKELFDSRLRLRDRTFENDRIWNRFMKRNRAKRVAARMRYAAVAAVAAGFSFFSFYLYDRPQPRETITVVKQREVHNTRGVYVVTLPDGSKAWLHGGTSLVYPDRFEMSCREVKLEGEAYFEVHSDSVCPFLVRAGAAAVYALGTEFNVTAYAKTGMVTTTLVKGRVEVQADEGTDAAALQPGEQATVSDVSLDVFVRAVDPELFIDWKEGVYRFNRESFEQICLRLEKMFGVNIVIETPSLKKAYFSGMFTENHSMKEVFEIIHISNPIVYRIQGKDVYIKEVSLNRTK